jgi:hypothetical protein
MCGIAAADAAKLVALISRSLDSWFAYTLFLRGFSGA